MYSKIAEISLKETLAYRIDLFGGIVNSVIRLVVMWFVWSAIFSSGNMQGITFQAMITYVSISAVLSTYGYLMLEFAIEEDVKTGSIANYLVKPFKYPVYLFFNQLGTIGASLITVAAPVAVIAFIFLNIGLPANAIAFLISVVLGIFISFLLSLLTGMWAFWTTGNI